MASGVKSGSGSAVAAGSGVKSGAGSGIKSGAGSGVKSGTGSGVKAGGSGTGALEQLAAASGGGGSPSPSPSGSTSGGVSTPESSAAKASGRKKGRKKGELELSTARIGFLGAGKMTESLVEGLIKYVQVPAKHIFVAAPSAKNLETFKARGCHVSKRLIDVFARYDCDVVFFCFHGSVVRKAFKAGGSRPFPITTNYIPNMKHPIYFLSLVSGVTVSELKKVLLNPEHPGKYKLEAHRVMVNTAVAQGVGICAVDCDPDSNRLSAPIRTLLSAFGKLEHVPEDQMDAACAAGGSGLGFAYYFINALADGAFKCGLDRQVALKYAAKTALCCARSMLESTRHPGELRDETAAPGGAAVFGLHTLDKAELASGVTAAVEAAFKRAKELAQID